MKKFILLVLLIIQFSTYAQETFFNEKPPVFSNCDTTDIEVLKNCFDNNVFEHIYKTFEVPENVTADNYKGEVIVLFEVDKEGDFRVIYVDAMYDELKDEAKRVFDELPNIQPATYNGKATFKQYSIPIKIPLVNQNVATNDLSKENEISKLEQKAKAEFDSVKNNQKPFTNKEYKSQLNIPFTHSYYSKFDRNINLVGTNSHTASKPFVYEEISSYYDFEAEKDTLKKGSDTKLSNKLWNERLIRVQGKDYWFAIDPIFDFEIGKDTEADFSTTYNNTRGISIQGGLGEKFNFYTSIFESQGRFAQYYNQYAESIRAYSPDPAIIPGRGIAKRFKEDSYDYPVAEAYLSYAPAKVVNLQFGHGKNFIGDGYRSLFLSDVASPAPFFKINTKFWKIKYTNTWMWLKDVREETQVDGAYLSKYMATHFLSWNVTKRLNIGLFESVIWYKNDNRGFDVNYLNPIIFYRAIEFETGQSAGNALVGISSKYKWNDNINLYGQFIIDEFSLDHVTGGEKSWKNKYGYQIGLKYFNAFKLKNLALQAEYNRVRPYTYSHKTIQLNYGHNNQSMAHLWGANFSELILIGRYNYMRWFAEMKVVLGTRGLDFNDGVDDFSYGGDIFRSYSDRPSNTGVNVAQGNETNTFYTNLQAGYLINPATNLKLFAEITFRNFDPEAENLTTFKSNTAWFNIGLRTDLFNWHFDL